MPIIKTVKGNLLQMFKDREVDVIVHGCNCFHTMGAGIAGQISKQYPQAYESDKRSTNGDRSKLGKYTIAMVPDGLIVNAYTQYYPGRENPLVLGTSIGEAFMRLSDEFGKLAKHGWEPVIGIPKIGCGIAGGDWAVIERVIDDSSPSLSIVVVEYDWK